MLRPTIAKLLFAVSLTALANATVLQAADVFHVLPGGGTVQPLNGTDWDHAYPATSIPTVLGQMDAGDTLKLGSGSYGTTRIIISKSGTEANRMFLVGEDTGGGVPFFRASPDLSKPPEGITVELQSGASYWTISNLRIERRNNAVALLGANYGVTIDKIVTWDTTAAAFYFRDADKLVVQNCQALYYRERGFQCAHSCDDVKFLKCTANGSGGGYNFNWFRLRMRSPVGFDFHAKNLDQPWNKIILLEDCMAMNNKTIFTGDPYEQGDGFKMEGRNEDITLRRCYSYGNRDGAYDLKGTNQKLYDCVAVGCSRGFKIWYDAYLTNCLAVDNYFGFQLADESETTVRNVTLERCTLYSATSDQQCARIEKPKKTAELKKCILAFGGAKGNYRVAASGSAIKLLEGSVELQNTAITTNLPRFHQPLPHINIYYNNIKTLPAEGTPEWDAVAAYNPVYWNGIGDNYDNDAYANPDPALRMGYQAVRRGVISYNLGDATNSLAPTEVAGAVPAANWSNMTGNNVPMSNLPNSEGVATTADISTWNASYGYLNNTTPLPAPMTDDAKMMRSQRGQSNSPTVTLTAVQVPYPKYDVYVYWGGRVGSESVPATMTVELQQLVLGAYATSSTRYIKDANYVWDGTYDESTATSAAAAVDGQEYVVFRDVTTPEFRIRATTAVRAGICGLQIVEK